MWSVTIFNAASWGIELVFIIFVRLKIKRFSVDAIATDNMEYIKLISGLVLAVTFIWLLMKNGKRTGFVNALLRVDTVLGIVAGVYLIFASTFSLLVH